jgi:hypothetical protein
VLGTFRSPTAFGKIQIPPPRLRENQPIIIIGAPDEGIEPPQALFPGQAAFGAQWGAGPRIDRSNILPDRLRPRFDPNVPPEELELTLGEKLFQQQQNEGP